MQWPLKSRLYSSVYSGADKRQYQSFSSLAFVMGIHQWPRKMFPFDDVIMKIDRDKVADIFPTTFSNELYINEKFCILIRISLKFVPWGPFNNKSALVQIMAWRRAGDKPSFELMMVSLLMHICVTRPQWVNPLAWEMWL